MDNENLVASIPAGCNVAIAMVTLELIAHGYYVANTFEIDSACATFADNICAHHGDNPCKCQLKVLQVFDKPSRSVNLIFHTYREITELYLDGEGIDAHELAAQLQQILLRESSKIQHLIDAQMRQYA